MTINVNGNRPRTGAATAARRRGRANRLAAEVGLRVHELGNDYLEALTAALANEAAARGLDVPDLFVE